MKVDVGSECVRVWNGVVWLEEDDGEERIVRVETTTEETLLLLQGCE